VCRRCADVPSVLFLTVGTSEPVRRARPSNRPLYEMLEFSLTFCLLPRKSVPIPLYLRAVIWNGLLQPRLRCAACTEVRRYKVRQCHHTRNINAKELARPCDFCSVPRFRCDGETRLLESALSLLGSRLHSYSWFVSWCDGAPDSMIHALSTLSTLYSFRTKYGRRK
jgi:hypothetical protein